MGFAHMGPGNEKRQQKITLTFPGYMNLFCFVVNC